MVDTYTQLEKLFNAGRNGLVESDLETLFENMINEVECLFYCIPVKNISTVTQRDFAEFCVGYLGTDGNLGKDIISQVRKCVLKHRLKDRLLYLLVIYYYDGGGEIIHGNSKVELKKALMKFVISHNNKILAQAKKIKI